MEKPISKLDAGTKKAWKFHQTASELQTWSAYLQQSAEKFLEELAGYSSRSPSTQQEVKTFQDVVAALTLLKKESALLKTRARRLHGPRR